MLLVIGNPEGLEGTVSDGIIAAFRENRSMIQITAPISPGSSGSPVLDESGQVLGIATLISKEGQNLNFAISAEAIREAISKSSVAISTTDKQSAKKHFDRGVDEAHKKDFQAAIADFSEAIRLQPDNADACCNRGLSYGILNQPEKAISDYTEAIRLQPDHPVFPWAFRPLNDKGSLRLDTAFEQAQGLLHVVDVVGSN